MVPQDFGLSSNIRLFADDCTLFREISLRSDCLVLQNDLDQILTWSHNWQLPLNTSKCKALLISNKRYIFQHHYYINDSQLDWVDSFKYQDKSLFEMG